MLPGKLKTRTVRFQSRSASASRTVLASFLALFVLAQAVLAGLLEFGPIGLRDPEYAVRADRFRTIHDRQPDRRWCIAFGSSRLAEGLRPAALPSQDGLLLFNFGLVGAAPVTQRLALERLLSSGVRPDEVILEYWPPYLFESHGEREEDRLDPRRLAGADWPAVGPYLRDWAGRERDSMESRLVSIWSHRFVLLNLAAHSWLPFDKRQDFRWRPLDEWGWLPGKTTASGNRAAHLALTRQYYARFLAADRFDPVGERAFADLLSLCGDQAIPVTLLWLPESTEFQSWYSPPAERLARERFAEWGRRAGVRPLDARSWIDDAHLGDGFHLDPDGAAKFTLRLANSLREGP